MCNQSAVRNKIEEYFLIAEHKFNRSFPRPIVTFTKTGNVAGTANSTTNKLNYNNTLLNENFDKFIISTVPHEVAHLIDNHVYETHAYRRLQKRSVHGKTWKYVMSILGANPKRCHNYDTSKTSGNKHSYVCTGCNETFQLGTIRHNRMLSGKASYSHCNGSDLILK